MAYPTLLLIRDDDIEIFVEGPRETDVFDGDVVRTNMVAVNNQQPGRRTDLENQRHPRRTNITNQIASAGVTYQRPLTNYRAQAHSRYHMNRIQLPGQPPIE